MARRRALSAREVEAIEDIGQHWVAESLYIQIHANGARSWLFRYRRDGKNFWHGLGAVRDVSLKEARQRAEELRVAVRRDGAHPVAERRALRAEITSKSETTTFGWCCTRYIATHEASWKNEKHRAQWASTLTTYAGPVMGKVPVDRIEVEDVFRVLEPIWTDKPETASRLRGRIEKVLGWAAAHGYRSGENPARWQGGPLQHMLPPHGRIQKITPRKAVPYSELPALVRRIRLLDSISASALLFTILTGARTTETLGASWEEIDFGQKVWTVPPDRMKAKKEHRVALSDAALDLLGNLSREGSLVFPGTTPHRPLSNMAMRECLKGLRDDGSTVHGFRSSFSTWAAEQTEHPSEIVEASLAHATGNAVELAYKRTDYLVRRFALMNDWAGFVMGKMA